jgi:hypothetical protein
MLKRVDELAWRAHAYGDDLYNRMPRQYEERPNSSDPLGTAWREAVRAAANNYQAVYALRELLAKKAGIEPPENELITIDGDTTTLAEWARLYGIPVDLILARVRGGADWESAITEPANMPELTATPPISAENGPETAPR